LINGFESILTNYN